MEKKIVSKKKAKMQSKKEEVCLKVVDIDGTSPECQTWGETSADRESSILKTKPKNRKRKVSYEEDVIDGFLMISYVSLEDLECDGPIKPGAILAGNEDPNSIAGVAPTKMRREGKGLAAKTGKSLYSDGQKKKRNDKLPKKPKTSKTEKCKPKTKKSKDDVATVTSAETPLSITPESQNKPIELIKNASANDLSNASVSVASITITDNAVPTPRQVSESAYHVEIEESVLGESIATKDNCLEFPLPRKPLSDFSINAIQGMRGTTSIPPSSPSETSSIKSTAAIAIAGSEESQTQTKSIATMTSDQKQDKSLSPMEVIMRKETGFQFRRFEETKISASIGGFSPIKSSSLSFDDAVIRKSLHRQIDLTGTSIVNNEKTKLTSSSIKGCEVLRRDSRSRSPSHLSDGQPPSSGSLSSSKESTKHQHQHQHIHQHQHSHQHQHFHPPFGMVPNGVFPHSYYSGIPYLPPIPGSTPHTHLPKPIPKPGKWCSLHVKIAHYITKAQKEVERVNNLNTEAAGMNRPGLHAFQAVPSRSNYDRDFQFQASVRPHMSASPKGMPHPGLLHGPFPREADRHNYHLQGRHHPYFAGRENLSSVHKRTEFEPPLSYSNLGHPSSAYRGLFDRERSSPPHLEAIFPRRNSERTLSELEKTNRLFHHDRSMLNLSSERETHHESERHRRSSFMDRDKTAYFQPVKLDAPLCRSSLASHNICGTDMARKPSPRRGVSPLSSPLVAAQKPHFRGNELFDRFRPESLEHRGLFGSENRLLGPDSRLLGAEGRLFGSESRLFGSDSRMLIGGESRLFGSDRMLIGGESRLFGSDKRIPSGEGRLFGSDARKSLLPFRHNTPLSSAASHAGVLGSLGRMSSKFTSSS